MEKQKGCGVGLIEINKYMKEGWVVRAYKRNENELVYAWALPTLLIVWNK